MNLVASIAYSRQRGLVPVVAEVKRVIPKLAAEGRGRDERDAGLLARYYEEGGAAGISLVTESKHFGGQPGVDIPAVLRATSLPLLIKDFILEPAAVDYYADVIEAVAPSAVSRAALLLIAHLAGERLPVLLAHVHRRGMLALVETRDLTDLGYLEPLPEVPRLVGINNKNIDTLEMGEDQIRLCPEMVAAYRRALGGALLVSESAHRGPADVRRSLQVGADAVLVGTAFLVSDRPRETVAAFVRAEGALSVRERQGGA